MELEWFLKSDVVLSLASDDTKLEIFPPDVAFDEVSVFAQAEQVAAVQIARIMLSKYLFFTLLTSRKYFVILTARHVSGQKTCRSTAIPC